MKTAKELTPACSIGECGFCPGNSVAVYAPGKRAPGEPPLFVYRCAHGCRHGGQPQTPSMPGGRDASHLPRARDEETVQPTAVALEHPAGSPGYVRRGPLTRAAAGMAPP